MVKTKLKLSGLLILNLGLLAVANDKFDDKTLEGRIYGGNDAAPGKWNFYCSLAVIKTQKEVFICGCVVIGSKWVASATHCTVDHPASNIHVYAGYPTSRFLNYEQNIVAKAKYEHPDYDPNYNDLVVIELKYKFKPSKFIQPVALPLSSGDVAGVGTTCKIAGFGETRSEKADEKDRTLQEGTVFVSKRFECLFAYGSYIRNSHICANNPHATTGVCRGDSGGPLVCRDHGRGVDVLRGVVSFGLDGCGDRLTPEVWTRISFYVDWIKTTMTECDFPELPPNTYTKNSPPGGKFKVGEILNLFCSDGYEQRSGSDMSVCGKDGSFDELDLKCIAKGLYGDWKIGSCSVTCGEGTRQDTRECLGGVCSEDLHRIAVCRLQPCPTGDDVCKSLHCSPHAACEMSDGEHKCVCLVEYEGDGVNCTRIENGPAPVANNSSGLCLNL